MKSMQGSLALRLLILGLELQGIRIRPDTGLLFPKKLSKVSKDFALILTWTNALTHANG